MKRFLILPLLLAACAPAVQTDPVATASRTYAAPCPAALDALTAVAVRTRPSVAFGASTWPTLALERQTDSGALYISRGRMGLSVTVQATCTGAATLTLATSGQRSPYGEALNTALLDGVALP